MELQDFLKFTKVRITDISSNTDLTLNKIYSINHLDTEAKCIQVTDDKGEESYIYEGFEPVLDESKSQDEIDTSADSVDAPHVSSPSNNDAPHVSERPSFKAGQKAYCPWLNEGKLVLLCSYDENRIFADTLKGKQVFNKDGTSIEVRRPAQPDLFHATQENYELLSKLMPWVDYEAPPKPLTGSHLARLLCVRGKRRIYGYASNDKDMDLTGIEALCRGYNSDGFLLAGLPVPCKYFVPADIDTGEPLTEAVLNN